MAKPDLIFITKENENKLQRAVKDAKHCEHCGALIAGPHDCPGPEKDEPEICPGCGKPSIPPHECNPIGDEDKAS